MKKHSELEDSFKKFILEHEKGTSVDDIKHKFRQANGQNHKMADFLIFNDKIILEMKSLFSDRVNNVNDKLNSLVKEDAWLSENWHGQVDLEYLIEKHPDSTRFRQRIMNFAYENIKSKVVKEASKQIGKTRDVLNLPEAIGGLILLNDKVSSLEPEYVSNEIILLLKSQKYSNVEFVIYISKLVDKRMDFCILLDSQSKNREFIEWYLSNVLMMNWASFNRYPIQF